MVKLKNKINNLLKNNNGVKFLTPFLFLIGIGLSGFLMGANIAHKKLKSKSEEIKIIRNDSLKRDSLQTKMQDSLEKEIEKLKNSKEDLRVSISKSSGINIPQHIPEADLKLMVKQADKYDIPHRIYFRLIKKESTTNKRPNGFDRNALNKNSGAKGYMQLMPGTYKSYARELGVKGANTPLNNLLVGSYYIGELKRYWSRKTDSEKILWSLVLASYNAGINRVIASNNSVPKINETKRYLDYILEE